MPNLTLNAPAIVRHDGYRIQVSNTDGDDFIRRQMRLVATRPDGRSLCWTIPDRLLMHTDVAAIAVDEICKELEELPSTR